MPCVFILQSPFVCATFEKTSPTIISKPNSKTSQGAVIKISLAQIRGQSHLFFKALPLPFFPASKFRGWRVTKCILLKENVFGILTFINEIPNSFPVGRLLPDEYLLGISCAGGCSYWLLRVDWAHPFSTAHLPDDSSLS